MSSYATTYYRKNNNDAIKKKRAERQAAQYRKDESLRYEQEAKAKEKERRQQASFINRAASTTGDVVGNTFQGLFKGLEGIMDLGAGIVGGIGGIFSQDFRDNVQDFVSKDLVGDSYGEWLSDVTKNSYLNDNETVGNIVRGVSSGVGQMLPAVALNLIPGVGTALSAATFMASAAGNNIERAYNEGADYYHGLAYGVASGALEGGIEALSGGIGGSKIGTVLGKQVGKSALGKLGVTVLGEGLEEVASDVINPALKGLTGAKSWSQVGEEYKEVPKQLPMTFAVGGLTGAVMGGAGKVMRAAQHGGFSQADISEMSAEKQEYNSAVDKLQASGKLTDESIENYLNTVNDTSARQAEKIAKLDLSKQTEYVNKYGAPSGFAMTSSGLTRTNTSEDVTRLVGLKQAVKNGTMSASLLTSQDNLKYNPIPAASSSAQQTAIKTVNMLAERGKGLKTVLTLDLPDGENARYENGVSYINARLSQDEMSKQAVIHEYTHSLEGTKQYANFADSLIKQMQNSDPNFTAVATEITNKYFDETKSQEVNKYIAQTELVSHYTSQLFTDETIKKIANADKSLATKVWEWIKNKIALLKAKRGGEEKYVTLRFLQRAETLYSQAIKTTRGGFDVRLIDKAVKEKNTKDSNIRLSLAQDGENKQGKSKLSLKDSDGNFSAQKQVDTREKMQYTKRHTSYISYDKIGRDNIYHIRTTLALLYSGMDGGIADGIAIEKGNTVYIVDSGNDNGNIDFGVREMRKIEDNELRNKIVENINERAISKGYVSIELLGKIRRSPSNDRSGGVGRELSKELSTDNRQPTHNEGRVSDSNADRGIRRLTNQSKLISNQKPTQNEDVRFSLAIGNENVTVEAEKTKNLVAIHNLSEENLLNVLELGGFPMPSIAVIKVDGEHSNYGNISVVFRPDAVNPQSNANNKIYSADAYTPRFPQTEYSLNYKEFKALASKLKTDMSSLEVNVFKGGDKERMINNLSSDREARELFVKESGLKVVPVLHDPKYSRSIFGVSPLREYIASGVKFHDIVFEDNIRKEFVEKIKAATELKSMTGKWADKINTELDEAKNDTFVYDIENLAFEKDAKIAKLNAEKVEDDYSYSDGLNNLIAEHRQEFDMFVDDLITPVLGKKWLRNSKQYYTNNGNPRSFESLHEEYTAENAMKIMNSMGSKNVEGGIFGYGVGEIRAALSKTYNSFDTLHKDESKIQNSQDELISEQYEKCTKQLSNICSEIAELIKIDNYFQASDIASSVVLDIISKTSTNSNAKAYVKREYTIDISDDIINSVRELGKKIEKLPVKYFEAKPKRVIDFSEIKNVLLPASASQNIKSKLQDKDIPYQIYDDTQENSRSQIIKTMDNVRFSKELDPANIKAVANVRMDKVYSKKEIGEAVDGILEDVLSNANYQAVLPSAKKQSVIDTLFNSFNTATGSKRKAIAKDIAQYLIKETALESIYKAELREQTVENSARIIGAIKGYVGGLDLSGIKGELEHTYDIKGAKGIMLAWNKKGGMGIDVAAQELESNGITIKATNEAAQFIEIKKLYDNAKRDMKAELDSTIRQIYTEEEIDELEQSITNAIWGVVLDGGEATQKAKYEEEIYRRANVTLNKLREKLKDVERYNKIKNQILDSARVARDMVKKSDYTNASIFNDPAIEGMLKFVAGFKNHSDIANGDKQGARQRAEELAKIYNENNQLLYSEDSDTNMLDKNVVSAIQLLAENANVRTKKGHTLPLNIDELKALNIISKGIIHLYKTYDNIYREGKLENITKIATRGTVIAARAQKANKAHGKMLSMKDEYFHNIYDPLSNIRQLDGYAEDGVFTMLWHDVTNGEKTSGILELQLMQSFKEFFAENKGYKKHLTRDEITVGNVKITVNQALSILLTSRREQAHMFESNIWLTKKKGYEKLSVTTEDIIEIQKQLTKEDIAYMNLAHDFFNGQAKDLKVLADQEMNGYTNIEDGNNYIPIIRDKSGLSTDLSGKKSFMTDIAVANNMPFNQNTKPGAKNDLYIDDLSAIVARHARGVSMYAGLALPLKNFNRVYNKTLVDAETNSTMSLREIVKHGSWRGAEDYLKKVFADMQGVGRERGFAGKTLQYMRGAYSKFQLGANLKTVLSQLSSFPMAMIYIDPTCMVKGALKDLNLKLSKESNKQYLQKMYEYCPMAKFRMEDKAVVKAEGLLDNIGKVGNLATKPIQFMDSAVIIQLWGGCQEHVFKHQKLAIGSHENLVEAGKLLEQVIRETQSNSIMSERSGMNRSNNFLVSSMTMFMSDATKQISRFADSCGELKYLKYYIKNGDNSAETSAQYKKAKAKLGRTITAMVTANLTYTLVAMFVRFIYDKDKKDKSGEEIGYGRDFLTTFAGQIAGMFPIFKDIYAFISSDYEMDNYAISMGNDILTATKSLWKMSEELVKGKDMSTSEICKPMRDIVYSIGQATGIPVRNVYNTVYGLIKRFNPRVAYKANSIFYDNCNYSDDIKQAKANGKDKMAYTIAKTEIINRGIKDDVVVDEISKFLVRGINVINKKSINTIIHDNKEIKLTYSQSAAISAQYLRVESSLKKLFAETQYNNLSLEEKESAVDFISSYYYNSAIKSVCGVDKLTNKQLAAKVIPIEKLGIYLAKIKAIKADKINSRQKNVYAYVSKLPLSAPQKYILMGLAGYKNTKGAKEVKSLINAKAITTDEKTKLYIASGY